MKIGRYEIIGELGKGAMGIVYKAQDNIIDRIVAIKTINLDKKLIKSDRSSMINRFYQEARIAGRLTHPNIATIFDVGTHNDTNYIVMEFVEGIPMELAIEGKKPITLHDKLRLVILTANVLHYAHQRGVIHRDVKPANIMLLKHSQIKVMDFGIAKIVSHEELSKTAVGTILGTPFYMSPEQIADNPLDRQTDVFSLGVLTYEFITGKKPFIADNLPSLIEKINKHDPFPPHKVNNHIPERISTTVMKALEKKKEKRYATAADFADAIEISLNHTEMKTTQDIGGEAKGYNKQTLIGSLKENYTFFSDFTDDEIQTIFKISNKEVYSAGDEIFEEGTVGSKMYIIINGTVSILKEFKKNEYSLLNTLNAGDCFGEMAIMDSSPRFATAKATTDCILIAINEVILRYSEPKLCLKLYKNLASILLEKLKKSDTSANTLMDKLKKIKEICS